MCAYSVILDSEFLGHEEAVMVMQLSGFECIEDAPQELVDSVIRICDEIKSVSACEMIMGQDEFDAWQEAADELLDVLTA